MSELQLPRPFAGSEHAPFMWQGKGCAALLIHGFPGSPAEMRPLGAVLKQNGWTVQGLTLPGLGNDIETLDSRTYHDWIVAVRRAAQELRESHPAVILVGYSMGGALALCEAVDEPPLGLVLLAPFWTLGEGFFKLLWPGIRLVFRRVKPLKHADFSSKEVRHGLQRMFASIDLDDPQIQQALRRTTVSLNAIEQIRKLGYRAFSRAPRLDVSTLVIQGDRDRVVPATRTKRLVSLFANPPHYLEVHAGHDIVDPASGAWGEVKGCLQRFAATIQERGEIVQAL